MRAPHNSGQTCPPSAVSHGVGLVGLVGLALWSAFAWHYRLDGPHAGMMAVVACGLPMILWSLAVDKVHRRPDTGIDWSLRRPMRETLDISIVKITGLWTTWGIIALFYMVGGWYAQDNFRYTMLLLTYTAPALVILSIPYVIWLDRRLVEPRDGAYAFGQWMIGGALGKPPAGAIANHARSWLVKAFFLAFMLSIVPGNFATVIDWSLDGILHNPIGLTNLLIATMFVVDVAFATAGYVLTMRPLDAHIRTANPLLAGWVAALICYPPFVLMGPGGPLFYETDTRSWDYWLAAHPMLLWLWGGGLVFLTGLYAWATVAFGLRFSNLTHRGILTHGPYKLTKHPAYLAKNAFWWCSVLPFFVTTDSIATAFRNTVLLAATSGVYYWRARTEEAHLSSDPVYVAYADWMKAHGPVPRLIALLTGKRAPHIDVQPAE